MDQQGGSLPHFQYGSPHSTYVKTSPTKYRFCDNSNAKCVSILCSDWIDDCVGKPGSSGEEHDGAQPEITAHFHLFEHRHVQADQAEVESDRQQRFGVEVKNAVIERIEPVVGEGGVPPLTN